jgi:N-acylneuraminate cytidylyltransferase
MRILALITARGGSKRLPGKNIRVLGGKPLIVWSIDVAKDIAEICDILVSTDDPAIAAVCTEAGVLVPWLRPADLATDTASSVDVVLHALDWYEAEKGAVDGVLLLQPTSPFRTKKTLHKGIELFEKHDRQPVLAISPTHAHPMWALKTECDYLVPFMQGHGLGTRSQDLPPAYVVNGSFYLISTAELRAGHSFVGAKTIPLLMESPQEALDIDTEWDWAVANAALVFFKGVQPMPSPAGVHRRWAAGDA